MKREKKKYLEAAGWKVGTASEFLGLTPEEAALIELKLDLAKAVRTERTRRQLTQEELGAILGSSQSRVAKMEAGDPSVSLDLLIRSLLHLGVTRRDLARHLGAAPETGDALDELHDHSLSYISHRRPAALTGARRTPGRIRARGCGSLSDFNS